MFVWDDEENQSQRRSFSIVTRKVEWLKAAGTDTAREVLQKCIETQKPPSKMPRSKCRRCRRTLAWGDGTYDFDHYNNRSYDNSQRNCYLLCKNCHGKHTRTRQVAVYDPDTGEYLGTATQKLKVGYKKNPRKLARKTTVRKPTSRTPKKSARKSVKKPVRKTARKRR